MKIQVVDIFTKNDIYQFGISAYISFCQLLPAFASIMDGLFGKSRKVEARSVVDGGAMRRAKPRHGPSHDRDAKVAVKRLKKDSLRSRSVQRKRFREEKNAARAPDVVMAPDTDDYYDGLPGDPAWEEWPYNIHIDKLRHGEYHIFREWLSNPAASKKRICIFRRDGSYLSYRDVELSQDGATKFDKDPIFAREWFITTFTKMKQRQSELIERLASFYDDYVARPRDYEWKIVHDLRMLDHEKALGYLNSHYRTTTAEERVGEIKWSWTGIQSPVYMVSTIPEDLAALWETV